MVVSVRVVGWVILSGTRSLALRLIVRSLQRVATARIHHVCHRGASCSGFPT
jgi:hypothetical protein